MIKLEKTQLYYYDGVLYESTEELKEAFIDKYDLLDDALTDFVTDEEKESLEIDGDILIKTFEEMILLNVMAKQFEKLAKEYAEKEREIGGKE